MRASSSLRTALRNVLAAALGATVAAFAAGLAVGTASAVLRSRRRSGSAVQLDGVATEATTQAISTTVPTTVIAETTPAQVSEGVVLAFTRPLPVSSVPVRVAARCGDTGGRTKAGAACGARAGVGGRCHHHRAVVSSAA